MVGLSEYVAIVLAWSHLLKSVVNLRGSSRLEYR